MAVSVSLELKRSLCFWSWQTGAVSRSEVCPVAAAVCVECNIARPHVDGLDRLRELAGDDVAELPPVAAEPLPTAELA